MPAFRNFLRFCLVAFAAINLALADVIELSAETFDEHVDGSTNVLVEFYAPWCGHCKNLAPEWKLAGETFQPEDDIKITAIDATQATDLAQKYGIRGYPTIKYFPKGSMDPEDYQGGRSAPDIVEWVNKKVGLNRKIKVAPSSVVSLTDETFGAAIQSGKAALVEFYAPWCGHCKALAPEYEKLGNAFAGDADVLIAKVDATDYGELANRYDVQGYPTLKYFPAGATEPEDYDGPRTAEGMLEFINNKAGTHRRLDGTLGASAGRVDALDAIISGAGFSISADVVSQIKATAATLEGKDAKNGKVYVAVAEKIAAKGADYVTKETARLTKVVAGTNIKPESKNQFLIKLNVLRAFEKNAAGSEEL